MDITMDYTTWSVLILGIILIAILVENLGGYALKNYFTQRAAKITAEITSDINLNKNKKEKEKINE